MTAGLWIALAAVVVAVAFGAHRARTDGLFRAARLADPAPEQQAATEQEAAAEQAAPSTWSRVVAATGEAPGETATLVQFSSAFCAPCRATRRTLTEVAAVVPGVVHVEVDAEEHLGLVRDLGILRTPTTLVLDAAGREVSRAAGAPRKEQVVAALGAAAG